MDSPSAGSLLDLAEQASANATGPNAKDALEQLDSRFGDLQAALAWFIDAGRTDDALRLANALYRFWITKQRFEDGAVWFDRVLASPGGDVRLRGEAFHYTGFMPFWMGDDQRAAELFARSLEIGRRLGDAPLISLALGGLARVALRTDVAEGRRLALVREAGNEFLIASETGNLSMVERQLGNLDTAEARSCESRRSLSASGISSTNRSASADSRPSPSSAMSSSAPALRAVAGHVARGHGFGGIRSGPPSGAVHG